MKKLVVLDYGTSNLRSVYKALEKVADGHYQVSVSGEPEVIRSADKIVFPGQGAIGQCMQQLTKTGLNQVICETLAEKPFLGICLGLQSLMDHSAEDGGVDGLALIDGQVQRFVNTPGYKVPHMGWNQVDQVQPHPLWSGIPNLSRFYFVHSYYVVPENEQLTCGSCEYINRFTAAIAKDNVFACQFHPEKSQTAGLKLLENFIAWKI